MIGVGQYVRLGTTVDDAMGEAFDKVAKMLGLPYPGGPQVERAAATGDVRRFAFPRPMQGRPDANFSLSGLKTAVRNEAKPASRRWSRRTSAISVLAFRPPCWNPPPTG